MWQQFSSISWEGMRIWFNRIEGSDLHSLFIGKNYPTMSIRSQSYEEYFGIPKFNVFQYSHQELYEKIKKIMVFL
jgi:hypothetical protein